MRIDALIEAAGWWSYAVVFAVTAGETGAFIGLLVPGETIILLASAIANRGDLNPLVLAAVVVAGGMAGDNLGYVLGRRCARRPSARRVGGIRSDRRFGRAQAFLVRHGGAAVFTGRFVGFVRSFLPFAAGASGMPYRRFFLYSTAASLVWGVGNVLLGYFAGAAATELLHSAGLAGAAALAAVGLALAIVVGVRILSRRRRIVRAKSSVVAHGGTLRAAEQEPRHVFTYSKEK
ncbi:DedA family protein [Streptomyces sp. NPDC059909]|uniref:DedA family protein n=1 Tax=Streptomyces sp. NPDC059909 TaxID=3346998 RepID=UPI0036675F7B